MRNSWNFSTAILEIWVLVLTKPGWANETPTTSLKDTGEYSSHHHNLQQHHHHPHQYQHHPSHHNHHYSLAGSISRDFFSSNINSHQHHQPHSSSSFYSNSGGSSSTGNNNRHYSHHHNHHQQQHHLSSQSALASSSYSPHRCYVCLPPNKGSREAQQILDIFAKELRPLIPDCSAFDPYVDAGRFEFDCPPRYGGCILRIHGTNISRACSKYRVNDCKKANSVEFCYCTTPLCNDKKPEPAIIPAVVHMSSLNAGGGGESNSMRRGSNTDGSKSSLRGRGADGGDEVVGNSQGIRARVDDEEVLGPDRTNVVDDDEDNGGSGTGSPDQHNTFIDPYTSTLDPTIFQEKSLGVDLEDPNPHTKIGIPITASTSSSSSSASSLIRGGRSLWSSSRTSSTGTPIVSQGLLSCVVGSWRRSSSSSHIPGCTNIIHLFLHLHRVLFLRLFTEQVVDEEGELQLSPHNSDSITGSSIDVTHYLFGSQPRRHHEHDQDDEDVDAEKEDDIRDELDEMRVVDGEPPGAATTTFPLLPLFFNSQLCFIISFLVVVKVLSS